MGWIVKAVPVATLVEIGQHANSGTLCEFNQYKGYARLALLQLKIYEPSVSRV